MSNKHKKPAHPPSGPKDLKTRIERSLTEGRSQQALDLARQLYKLERTAEHQEVLKRASLARARHLLEQGYSRDAASLLETAQQIDPSNPAWLLALADLLARSGAVQKALSLLPVLPDSPDKARILTHAVDAAVQQQAAGRATLPATLQPDFDRVVQAFRQTEAGQDEQARDTLQGIGLRSPFLEWKLLLRGLQAYYQNDDARALENWQRLDSQRLPARLAAIYRFQIDPAFRSAQPAATQEALKKQVERLQGPSLAQQLKQWRRPTANRAGLSAAFRELDSLIPTIRQQAPQLLPRLARFFYWSIVKTGPDDILRYRRVFGPPADDPSFHRLQALGMENVGNLEDAHEVWQSYEKDVAGFSWPADEVKRARALIWLRMGKNAQTIPSHKKLKKLPVFLRDDPDRPDPLDPPAEQCFRKSLALSPDLLQAHEALFLHEIDEERPGSAIKAGQALLEHFPDHVPTLEKLADLLQEKGNRDEALTLLQRAVKNNPLNRRLRGELSTAHQYCARAAAETSRFEEARQHYQLALDFDDQQDHSHILCKQAACEFKAGETARAEELVQQARTQAASSLDVSFHMLIEVSRLNLDKALKKRFEKEFTAGLAEPPTAGDALAMLETVASHQFSHVVYTGSKTQFKKVLSYVEKARLRKVQFSEQQLERLCTMLIDTDAGQRTRRGYLHDGQMHFRENPVFDLLEVEYEVRNAANRFTAYRFTYQLAEAERKTNALPEGPRKEQLLARITDLKGFMGEMNPFGSGFPFFDMFDPFGEDEDDDDER